MAESELTTIARPYARAAFSQALKEAGGLENWSRMMSLLSATVQNPDVRLALDNPRITISDEAAIVVDLMGEELNTQGQNFVHVLADYRRISLLPQIAEMFQLLKAHHEKTMNVEIVSAYELDESTSANLASALKDRLQREIKLSSTVDASLIGGVVIRAEDTVIDNSVRGKLEKLSQALN
ncbi:MAG: F0F1 ATP synthase subunit delta [Pseudomonadales bacterium]|nr:F0F1 ATP synthase subunit delta [Pseudomonadales bacterium]